MQKKKQLTFDIDTNVAKEILGEQSYTMIYSHVKSYMEKENWIHIEGSVYMSSKPLSNAKVAMLIDGLKKEYPYITKCIRNMHQSDITNVHSLESQFEYDGTAGEFAKKENDKDNTTDELRIFNRNNKTAKQKHIDNQVQSHSPVIREDR